jgi:hypothetical protein
MIKFYPEEIINELEKGLGKDGDLTIGIYCCKCGAQFEIGREGAAMAVLSKTTFLEYLRWVQSSKCSKCNGKAENG